MKIYKFKNLSFLIFTALFFSGCGGGIKTIDIPVKIETFKITETAVKKGLYYSGTVEAGQNIDLSFLNIGTVDAVYVREGDKVKKGQLLANLNSQNAKNAMDMAKEKALQAEDAFKRFQPMYEHGNLPEIKMVEIKTSKNQAELAAKIAEKNYSDCYLYAPCDGFISERNIEPGASIIPGKTAIQIVRVDKVYAVISVPEKEIQKIKKGMDGEVEVSENEIKLKGKVTDVGVSADVFSRTYTVRILIANKAGEVLPGMLCNVYVLSNDVSSAVVIPAAAVKVDEEGKECVYVIDSVS
jgi:RND family efflux transporter MFP subunit